MNHEYQPVFDRSEGIQRSPALENTLQNILFSRHSQEGVVLSSTTLIQAILANCTGSYGQSGNRRQ